VAGYGKCLATCRKRELEGAVPAGVCAAGAESDPKTIDCIVNVAEKPLALVEDPAIDAPECLEPLLSIAVTYLASVVADFDVLLYCADVADTGGR
jgi:hypothetical protein